MTTTNVNKPASKVTGNQYLGYLSNKRKAVFAALDKNPLLTPVTLVAVLEIPSSEYKKEKAYLKKLKYEWKGYHKSERGSIRCVPDEVHNVFYRGELSVDLVRDLRIKLDAVFRVSGAVWVLGYPFSEVNSGWRKTASRNHFLLYKNRLGRVRLFDTGTVELYVRKPASKGKAMQLFSYAFINSKLIDSIQVLEKFQKNLLTRMHAAFDVGQRLPNVKIGAFKESHGFTFVSGDRSDPTKFEFMFEYNAEVEAARNIFAQVGELLKGLGGSEHAKRLTDDYSR